MRRLLALAALAGAALFTAVPAADAASSKGCRKLAGSKAKVVAKGKEAIVYSTEKPKKLYTKTYYACRYAKPRLYKIPGQNGEDTEYYSLFTFQGRYVAWRHTNEEHAARTSGSWVETVDLKTRKLVTYEAFPGADLIEVSTTVHGILLRDDGAIAWIGSRFGQSTSGDEYTVQTALRGQTPPSEVERGGDIGPKSLRRVAGNDVAFSYTRAGVRKEAAFGGPTLTP